MHPEYARFLSFFRNIVRISLDQAKHVPGKYEDEANNALDVTADDFFKYLYEPREVVDQLIRNLTWRRDLLCLIGPRGSGKTTTIRSVQRELENQQPESSLPRYLMTLIDLRIETTTTMFMTDSITIEQSLRARLKTAYLRKFFPFTRKGANPRLKLWAFLLDAERADLQPDALFSIFRDLQDRTTALLRRYDAHHKREISGEISVEEWLAHMSDESAVNEITSEVEKRVDFSHLVHAVHHVENIAQQVVWLDNADILSDKQQTDTMIAIRRLLTPIASLVRMGISIREENVFREYDISDDGAPPMETRVMVEIPRGSDNRPFYPSKDIPLATLDLLRKIIHKRLDFTRKAQVDAAARLNKEIELAGSGKDNLHVNLLNKQLASLTPVISHERFGIVQRLAGKLVKQLHREGAILMANNSLRDYMMILRDCLADLLTSKTPNEDNAMNALNYEPWYLSTLYFRRIRHSLRRYRGSLYDVLAATNEWFKQGRQGTGCLLSHLILVTSWNILLGEKGPEHGMARSPRVGDIVCRLVPLGYSRSAILENLHSMYFHNGGRQNLIEIRGRTPITTPEEVTDDMRVYITYRGKGLTARIGGSFGYLYGCLQLLEGETNVDEGSIEHPAIQSTNEGIEKLLPHLCDVAQMHYLTLRDLHLNKGISYQLYMQKFGIPAVAPYRKRGEPLLQFQMIVSRLLRYAQNSSHESGKLLKLYEKYSESIKALDHIDPSAPVIDFRDFMDVQPRVEKRGV